MNNETIVSATNIGADLNNYVANFLTWLQDFSQREIRVSGTLILLCIFVFVILPIFRRR